MRVALVSDTHGASHPGLPGLFRGCALILHAGDVVTTPVLHALAAVAPVTAVRGNNDLDPCFDALPLTALVRLGALHALVVHDLGALELPRSPLRALLAREQPEIVVHGHSHHPGAELRGPTLFVNPGSAGPRRFHLPRTAALLTVSGRRARVDFYDLSGPRAAPYGQPVEMVL